MWRVERLQGDLPTDFPVALADETETPRCKKFAALIAEAHQGAVIVLTDGQRQVWLDTHKPLDLETDNSELEAELLEAVDGPFTADSSAAMRSIGERIIEEERRQ